MNDEKQQRLVLHSTCEPSLKGGEYAVEVTRELSYLDSIPRPKPEDSLTINEKLVRRLKFRVATAQFSLPPADIFECYPADGVKGVFSDTLPHVVLSRRTLPWERTPGTGQKAPPGSSALACPWLALLLLSQDELGITRDGSYFPLYNVETVAANELPQGQRSTESEKCQVLKLPFTLFAKIAPTWDDLPYSAHVREVGNTENMDSAGIDDKGWFSVIVCNRLPAPGKENHVFLVSLEGLKSYPPSETAQNDGELVTLVVLAKWRFVDCSSRNESETGAAAGATGNRNPDGETFAELLDGLNCSALRRISLDKEINSILQFGYVPVIHHTTEGYRTVSWYRGPLTPHFIPTPPKNISYPSADAALRYDPQKGLLDVSYAAAWQLGRLLGLQDQPFARALRRITSSVARKAAENVVAETVAARFGTSLNKWKELVENIFQGNAPKPPSGSEKTKDDDYYKSLELKIEQGTEIPLEIRQWLGHLFLLHGVPFHYLVPDPELLPAESLRVFYLDSSWIAALMDGALSVGRTPQSQLYLDKAMAGNFLADIATKELQCSDNLDADKDIYVPAKNDANIVGHITGFLLRSRLIEAWRGIEIVAMACNATGSEGPASILRMQRISKDTLLGIYNGHIRSVVITQPPQGLHFGVDERAVLSEAKRVKLNETAKQVSAPGKNGRPVSALDRPAVFAAALLKKRVQRTIRLDVRATKPGEQGA